jgi:hypothetical protein
VIVEIVRQRFHPALRAPVMTAGVAHRGDEPGADVLDLRAGLQEREEDFLDEVLRVAVGDAELAAGDVQQKVSVLDVQSFDFFGRQRWRRGRNCSGLTSR